MFGTIAILAHREKLQKKRNNQLGATAEHSSSSVESVVDDGETSLPVKNEEKIVHSHK